MLPRRARLLRRKEMVGVAVLVEVAVERVEHRHRRVCDAAGPRELGQARVVRGEVRAAFFRVNEPLVRAVVAWLPAPRVRRMRHGYRTEEIAPHSSGPRPSASRSSKTSPSAQQYSVSSPESRRSSSRHSAAVKVGVSVIPRTSCCWPAQISFHSWMPQGGVAS